MLYISLPALTSYLLQKLKIETLFYFTKNFILGGRAVCDLRKLLFHLRPPLGLAEPRIDRENEFDELTAQARRDHVPARATHLHILPVYHFLDLRGGRSVIQVWQKP